MKFIEEIEHAIGCTPGSPCTLNAFLADYIKEVFLGRHHMIVAANIESATKSVDAWRATTSPELMRGLGLSRPLLQVPQSCATFSTLLLTSWVLKGKFPMIKLYA
jgi:exocyst complex component 4